MQNGISPEEILREREEKSGFSYESPKDLEDSPEDVITESKGEPEQPRNNPLSDRISNNLGKSRTKIMEDRVLENGWKNLPLETLPSQGMFYPQGTRIAIRPADVKEIRHFSGMDEDDRISVNESLNYILDRCMVMEFPNTGVVSYKDIIQEDRFYLIMAIRDLTFIQGENRIILNPTKKCDDRKDCPFKDGIELRTGSLSSFSLSDRIMEYYSPEDGSFNFRLKKFPEEEIKLYIPTIGITDAISNFVSDMRKRNINVDKSFIKIAPFLFYDWREINTDIIYSYMRESELSWSKEKFSLFYGLTDEIKIGTKMEVSVICPTCNKEVKSPILFKNGIKSLFVISDIFGELL